MGNMLTQDYVSWVVIGAIDSTTDQLLFAHVCFGFLAGLNGMAHQPEMSIKITETAHCIAQ
ncbi:TPA: hypothetical protein ACU525_004330 [Yersinia enterocolitica]|uniref:hypothetical protein n=1 Tax=Yersinia intermedia TaxID=631 RepID=UPI00067C9BF9|nr:hypothetical protein [Yersinia intermedia]